jgi:hypothetical protein
MKKFIIKETMPATITKTIEVLATDEKMALSIYLKGFGVKVSTTTQKHHTQIEYDVDSAE